MKDAAALISQTGILSRSVLAVPSRDFIRWVISRSSVGSIHMAFIHLGGREFVNDVCIRESDWPDSAQHLQSTHLGD